MSRLALFCVLTAAVASAQPAEFTEVQPQTPTVRVLESSAAAVTIEVTTQWRVPLAEAVERSGTRIDGLVALAAAGRTILSHEVSLAAAVPPAATVVSFEGEEVLLSPEAVEAFGALAAPAAEVVGVGERRRELVGSLAMRVLRLDGNRLIRARRMVVRVPRPPVAARLATSGASNPHLAVDRSRLADGRWFKVPVPEDGIYRVNAAFLRDSLKIEGDISLASVGVYGTGGRILPALNSAPRPADLLPVASLVVGDALLFYAEGPSWWDWNVNGARWEHDISPFSDVSYYFLRIDDPAPARVGDASFPAWTDAQVLATIDDRRFYEEDFVNIERDGGGSGLDWLGPDVRPGGSALVRLDEPVPGATSASPVRYRARVAARARPEVTFTMSSNGQALDSGTPFPISTSNTNTGNLANDATLNGFTTFGSGLAVSFRATGGNQGAGAWLDWVEAVVSRPAVASAEATLRFPTPGGAVGRFETTLTGFASQPRVWDVTDAGSIRPLGVAASGGGWRVQVEATDPTRPREIVAFDPAGSGVRALNGLEGGASAVPNQNLHAVSVFPDYVVVSHPDFLPQAERLAAYRQQRDGLVPFVVTTEQVFNEFAGGVGDMRAVRDFMKFLYDRAPSDQLPGYLLLFGDGHYDFRNIKSRQESYVPTYQSEDMFSRSASFMSDDYFGLLGDDEGIWGFNNAGERERVDIAIGRIPARTIQNARTVVNKVLRYEDPATHGDWRTRFTFIADDQYPNDWDDDVHVLNSDGTAELAEQIDPTVTLQKIYGPSYPDIVTARGRLRPQATEAVRQSINAGTLVWNYSGHGGPTGLGDEEYVTEELVASLDNPDRLPVFVTATCSFGKFDIADTQSLAERILLRDGGGGVAMLTTVRLVFTGVDPRGDTNFGLNLVLTEEMLRRDPDGRPSRLGDALARTKNTAIGSSTNNRKFNLLGDPAMRLGLPERPISINSPPSLRAFDEATVSGQVLTLAGEPDPTYRGSVQLEVFDASRKVTLPEGACCFTDGPDADRLGDYAARTDRIYSGRASVRGGQFSATFLVPQDVSYSGLPARIVAYAIGDDGSDGVGTSEGAIVAADAADRPNDTAGPEISLFVNDSTFVDGGTTSPDGVLVATLQDANGINTVGAGVGHELLLVIDGDQANAINVSQYYQGDLDTYRSGTVRVPLSAVKPNDQPLAAGTHTATLTAWDALNNASTASVQFVIVDEGVVIGRVLPYPNPTAGPARFFVEHNQPVGTPAKVQLRIYTLAGRPVRTIGGVEALPDGFLTSRTLEIPWDGLDDDFDRLGSGIYLVRLRMEVPDAAGGALVGERVDRLAIIR